MPEQDYTDRLKDYVQVKDRIVALYELFGTARIETTYELTSEPDAKPKVICRAHVYRTPDDPHPSTGTSWLYLPGTTPYTKGSEIENAETSAIGRAIGFLGILIDKSIASANEIAGKQSERNPRVGAADHEPPPRIDYELIGTAEKGTARTSDYLLRETPTGHFLGFRLKADGKRGGQLIEAHDAIAEALAIIEADVIGQRVQVFGHLEKRDLSNGGAYQAFVLVRLTTPTVTIPPTTTTQEADAAVASSGEAAAIDPASPHPKDTANHCDAQGPYSEDERCDLAKGHLGPHKNVEGNSTWL